MFQKLVEARDRLLAALGTSSPPPKSPVLPERRARDLRAKHQLVQGGADRQRFDAAAHLTGEFVVMQRKPLRKSAGYKWQKIFFSKRGRTLIPRN